jgi:hypothetical protein
MQNPIIRNAPLIQNLGAKYGHISVNKVCAKTQSLAANALLERCMAGRLIMMSCCTTKFGRNAPKAFMLCVRQWQSSMLGALATVVEMQK